MEPSEFKNGIPPEIRRIFEAKEERRRRPAALPWPEKVRIVVELQRRAAPILRQRGIEVRVWGDRRAVIGRRKRWTEDREKGTLSMISSDGPPNKGMHATSR